MQFSNAEKLKFKLHRWCTGDKCVVFGSHGEKECFILKEDLYYRVMGMSLVEIALRDKGICEKPNFEEIAFDRLVGVTVTHIYKADAIEFPPIWREDMGDTDIIVMRTIDNDYYLQFHPYDCCSSARLEIIEDDIENICNSPIVKAEVVTDSTETGGDYSNTWTYYKLATINGSCTMSWRGESNGYYSEEVNFYKWPI